MAKGPAVAVSYLPFSSANNKGPVLAKRLSTISVGFLDFWTAIGKTRALQVCELSHKITSTQEKMILSALLIFVFFIEA